MESNKFDWGKFIKVAVIVVVVLGFIGALWLLTSSTGNGNKDMTYSDYIALFERDEVESYSLDLGKGKLVVVLRQQPTEDMNKDGKLATSDARIVLRKAVGLE